jgi:uncharacterized protein (DUF302 family)
MREELGYEVRLTATKSEAIDKVTEALKAEGFGVLTRIEMDQAFKEKIGVHFRPYTILGVCNPDLAHAALTSVPEIGLMLPFNVTVEADINGSLVRIVNPAIIMQTEELADNDELRTVASDAQNRLQRVAESLRAA